jgi:hypothetical protein
VLAQPAADPRSRPEDEVDDPRVDARFVEAGHQQPGRERGHLARLNHHGVTGGERRGELPGDLQQGVVPRGDEGADADRLVHDPAAHAGSGNLNLPVQGPAGRLRVVTEHGHHVVDVLPRLSERLAGVERLGAGELLLVPHQQLRHPGQQRAAFYRWGARPGAPVEGAPSGGDGGVHVGGGGPVDVGEHALIRRVDDLVGLAVGARAPGAGEEQIGHAHLRRPGGGRSVPTTLRKTEHLGSDATALWACRGRRVKRAR